jgi:hypothetical protein
MTVNTTIKSLLGAVAAAALGGAGVSQAAITYTVDQVIGDGSVTGTITTDGATGLLSASDITAWNLLLTGKGGATFTLVNGPSGVLVGNISQPFNPTAGNNDLTADTQHIYFNYSGTDGGYLGFQTNPFYGGNNYWCNASQGQGFDCAVGKSVVPVLYSDPSSQYQPASGEQIIASVASSAPEPASWAMMLAGFGALGAALRRARREQGLVTG